MQRAIVLRSQSRTHPSNLHFPSQNVERVRQRLRNRACSVPEQTIGIRRHSVRCTLTLGERLTGEGTAGQLADDGGLIRGRDHPSQRFVRGEVDAYVWGHTHRRGHHPTIQGQDATFFPHHFERHPPHREVFGGPGGMFGRVEQFRRRG